MDQASCGPNKDNKQGQLNVSIVSATNIGDMSITKQSEGSCEKEKVVQGAHKVVHTSMEKIKEENDEADFVELPTGIPLKQRQLSDY